MKQNKIKRTQMEVRESETVEAAVKRVIADLEDCPVSKLGSISHCVDITDLNDIVDSNPGPEKTQSLSFYYCGYEVVIYNDRTIQIAN